MEHSRKAAGVVLAIASALGLAGCASARVDHAQIPIEPQVIQSDKRVRKEYVLSPGDQVDVVVRRVPEASRLVAIRPDGYITLPFVNDVMAAGLTFPDLKAKLTQLLSARLVDPEVTVVGVVTHPAMVYVVGDVVKPAAVPLADAPTAMHAVALAGGLARSAALRDVAVIRVGDDGYVRAIVPSAKISGQPAPYMVLRTLPLQADDVVFVPESGRSQAARFINDFLVNPLHPIQLATAIWANFRIIENLPYH